MPQEYANFPLAKNVRLVLAPTMINKDVFEPSKNGFKIQIGTCYSFGFEPGSPQVSKSGQGQQNNQTKRSKDLVTIQKLLWS